MLAINTADIRKMIRKGRKRICLESKYIICLLSEKLNNYSYLNLFLMMIAFVRIPVNGTDFRNGV